MNARELSIIMPAFNEADNLPAVVTTMADELEREHIDYEIRVVDNGSTDNTADVLSTLCSQNNRITAIRFVENQGYGGGVRGGLIGADAETLGWVDADGQGDPADIVRLYRLMRSQNSQLAKAVRVVRHESAWRKIQTRVYNLAFQILFLTRYRDINAKPKLVARRALHSLALTSSDFFLDAEFVIKALRLKLSVCELETVWGKRQSGSTRIHLLSGVQFIKNMLAYRVGIK